MKTKAVGEGDGTRRDPRGRRSGRCWIVPAGLLALGLVGCGGTPAANSDAAARSQVERGPVKLTVTVEPKVARLSDELVMTVAIDAAEGVEIEKPIFGEEIGEFTVRDFREPLPKMADGRVITTRTFTLEPRTTGTLTLDPIRVTFKDKRATDAKEEGVESEALTVQVTGPAEEERVDLGQLKPAASPIELPAAWNWVVIGGIGAAAIAALAAVVLWRRRRRAFPVAPELSPRELAELELTRLLESGLARTDVKLFYVQLTGIVRRYIERTVGIHAPEQTTEEFLREIAQHPSFAMNQRDRLGNFLESADLVKFAGYQPLASAIEESVRRARVFVDLATEPAPPHEPIRNGHHPETKGTEVLASLGEESSR